MNWKGIALLLLAQVLSISAHAHSGECQLNLVLKTEFARLAAAAYSKGILIEENLRNLKTSPNPAALLAAVPKTTENLVFLQNLARLSGGRPLSTEVGQELDLILTAKEEEKQTQQEAKHSTRMVFAPKLVPEDQLPKDFVIEPYKRPARLKYDYDQPVRVLSGRKTLYEFQYEFLEASNLSIPSEHYHTDAEGNLWLVAVMEAYRPKRWEEAAQLHVHNVTQKKELWKLVSEGNDDYWVYTSPFFYFENKLSFIAFTHSNERGILFQPLEGSQLVQKFDPPIGPDFEVKDSQIGHDGQGHIYLILKGEGKERRILRLQTEVER